MQQYSPTPVLRARAAAVNNMAPAPRGSLHVIIHSASGLPAADFSMLKKPSSDPYCVMTVQHHTKHTRTIHQNLNPTWEEAFTFQIGTCLPSIMLRMFGLSTGVEEEEASAVPGAFLQLSVFDEDQWTADDKLGTAAIDLQDCMAQPADWLHTEVTLMPPKGVPNRGKVSLSLCWEPAPLLPPYGLRMLGTIDFSIAAGCFFIAANCRWQSSTWQEGAAKQPGVGATVMLAALLMLLGTGLQFLLAHIHNSRNIDDMVAEQSGEAELKDALSMFKGQHGGKCESTRDPAIVGCLAPKKLTTYEFSVTPTIDALPFIILPIYSLGWLLPTGGSALGVLALVLQLQNESFSLHAGEVITICGVMVAATGFFCSITAEQFPARRNAERRARLLKSRTDYLREQSLELCSVTSSDNISNTSQNQGSRRRDVFWRKVTGAHR